ncbi:unnamed protein product [Soboliphyme baturini]|uniref:Rho-GAP domain-containing protein n=1 Tax=Soboliphyme baturini TaxID=241478 RepID=A0A183IE73_9BILA|nr:unnamed protein product [Soboliphyme baturini]
MCSNSNVCFLLHVRRFVSFINELNKPRMKIAPAHKTLTKIGVAKWVVSARNLAVHGRMPGLTALRDSFESCWDWILISGSTTSRRKLKLRSLHTWQRLIVTKLRRLLLVNMLTFLNVFLSTFCSQDGMRRWKEIGVVHLHARLFPLMRVLYAKFLIQDLVMMILRKMSRFSLHSPSYSEMMTWMCSWVKLLLSSRYLKHVDGKAVLAVVLADPGSFPEEITNLYQTDMHVLKQAVNMFVGRFPEDYIPPNDLNEGDILNYCSSMPGFSCASSDSTEEESIWQRDGRRIDWSGIPLGLIRNQCPNSLDLRLHAATSTSPSDNPVNGTSPTRSVDSSHDIENITCVSSTSA